MSVEYSNENSSKTPDLSDEKTTHRDRLLELPHSIMFINNIEESEKAIIGYYKKIMPLLSPEYKFKGDAPMDKRIDTRRLCFFVPYSINVDDLSQN